MKELITSKICMTKDIGICGNMFGGNLLALFTISSIICLFILEDRYFEKSNGWQVLKKENEHTYFLRKHNEKIESGEYLDKENYPNIRPESLKLTSEEEIHEAKSQFHHGHCCGIDKDKDILYIYLHY